MNRRQWLGSVAGGLLGASGQGLQGSSGGGMLLIWGKSTDSDTPLFPFEVNGKLGYIDVEGKVAISPRFKESLRSFRGVGDFQSGLARLENRGYINSRGDIVIGGEGADSLSDFSEGIAIRSYPDRKQWIDVLGQEVASLPPESMGSFSEGMIAASEPAKPSIRGRFGDPIIYRDFSGRMGFRNRKSEWAIPAEFSLVGPFCEGRAFFAQDGNCFVYGMDGRKYGSASIGAADSAGQPPKEVTELCRVGFLDKTGKAVIAPRFERAKSFLEGMAPVRLNGRWGFIDHSGQLAVAVQFDEVEQFSNGIAAVKMGKLWGAINLEGKMVIEPRFVWPFFLF